MCGVGEKTAAKLISTYGGLDGIFAHLDELTLKLRGSLRSEARVRKNLESACCGGTLRWSSPTTW